MQAVLDAKLPLPQAEAALLAPPLYQSAWLRGYGTLYSASYQPRLGQLALLWPGQRWQQSLQTLAPNQRHIQFLPAGAAPA